MIHRDATGRAVFAAGVLLGTTGCALGVPSFQGLGFLPGGTGSSEAYGISADGTTIVGLSTSAGGPHYEGFKWTAGSGMVGLGDLPGGIFKSSGAGCSGDGSIIVGGGTTSLSATSPQSVMWSGGGAPSSLGILPFPSIATDVSDDGSIIGGLGFVGSNPRGYRWTSGGGTVILNPLTGDTASGMNTISGDGSTSVGWSANATDSQAVRWTSSGTAIGLGFLPGGGATYGGPFSYAEATSGDGSIIFGQADSSTGIQGFMWTSGGGMIGIGDLPGGDDYVSFGDASADGSLAVGQSSSAAGYEAFVWTQPSGMISLKDLLTGGFGLDLTGWTLDGATGVSADGTTICGIGTNPDGIIEAWVAVIPAPGSAAVLAGAGFFVPRRRR